MNNPFARATSSTSPTAGLSAEGRDAAIDTLRTFVVVLVVFLHAAIGYTSFSVYDPAQYIDATAPVVDPSRWAPLDLPVVFIDTFSMPLLFLISGLFVFSGLERKGSAGFFLARLKRLGIPFAVAAFLISPLAFWPSYLMSTPSTSTPYWIRFFTTDGWLIGAPWFLWLLLAFDGIAALIHRVAPDWLERLRREPTEWGILLVMIGAYVPVRLLVSPYAWITRLGPFDVQASRILLYFACFLLGMALGGARQRRNAGWPRHWGLWFLAALISFPVYLGSTQMGDGLAARMINSLAFTVCCAGGCLGFLGAIRLFAPKRIPIIDSLNANAFGVFLFHYPIVHWLQYALIPLTLPAPLKFCTAFLGGLFLSWGVSALIRKIPAVRQII
jgi:glucan biosynthesis protein C